MLVMGLPTDENPELFTEAALRLTITTPYHNSSNVTYNNNSNTMRCTGLSSTCISAYKFRLDDLQGLPKAPYPCLGLTKTWIGNADDGLAHR
jgi:hypothetical protein